MSAKIPPARRFPKRLSQQELKDKTTAYMNENGADNHFKAEYYCKTAEEVVGLKDHIFFTLQPNIKHNDYKNNAWNRTYDLVIKWLQENQMQITLETMEKEFGSKGMPPEDEEISDVSQYFDELEKISKKIGKKDFETRVQEWKEEDEKASK